MKLNTDKCKALTVVRNKQKAVDSKYSFQTSSRNTIELERVNNMNDLGVTIDSELAFNDHIYDKINKAYQMIGIIKRNFKDLDKFSFLLIYKSLVRSHLEYANAIWNPYRVAVIADIEKVQKRATKLVKGLRNMTYRERLINLQLPTLKFRRVRGDMIEVYKILSHKYDEQVWPTSMANKYAQQVCPTSMPNKYAQQVCPGLNKSEYTSTRGHSLKLTTERAKYDLRKYSFTSRIVTIWNSLPNSMVCSESVNNFKNQLDALWRNTDLFYNYEAELPGS
jgi:hypothetical protein